MDKKKPSVKSNATFFSIGLVFLILGMNDYHMSGNAHGTVFVTIGLLFFILSFSHSGSGRKKKNTPPVGNLPHDPKASIQPEPYESEKNENADVTKKSAEDLKALYESGILTKEEYQERMAKLRQT